MRLRVCRSCSKRMLWRCFFHWSLIAFSWAVRLRYLRLWIWLSENWTRVEGFTIKGWECGKGGSFLWERADHTPEVQCIFANVEFGAEIIFEEIFASLSGGVERSDRLWAAMELPLCDGTQTMNCTKAGWLMMKRKKWRVYPSGRGLG